MVFADNGAGVRGDLRAIVKAILLDAEARASLWRWLSESHESWATSTASASDS